MPLWGCPAYCCKFPNCKNNSSVKSVSLFRFPKDERRCQAWVDASKNPKLIGMPAEKLYKSARICSDHFQDWCFMNINDKKRLVHNAIPNSPKPPPQPRKIYHEYEAPIMNIKLESSTHADKDVVKESPSLLAQLLQAPDPSQYTSTLRNSLSSSVEKNNAMKTNLYRTNLHPTNEVQRPSPNALSGLSLPRSSANETENTLLEDKTTVRILVVQENNSCCIPGCQSKSHMKIQHGSTVREKKALLFPVPQTDSLFNKWKDAVKGINLELTKDNHICELHFQESDIEKYDRTITRNGDIIDIKKEIPTLKPDAVPTTFLKSYHLTKNSSEKQSSLDNSTVIKSEKGSVDSILGLNVCDSRNSAGDSEAEFFYDSPAGSPENSADLPVNFVQKQISHKKTYMPYNELLKNIQLVKRPSKFWSVVCTDLFIIFARWNNKFIAEKRLVIESSSIARVFLNDWELKMTELMDITSVDDISLLLEKIESYSIDLPC